MEKWIVILWKFIIYYIWIKIRDVDKRDDTCYLILVIFLVIYYLKCFTRYKNYVGI